MSPVRVLITRPRDDSEALAAALAARGVDSLIEPLLKVEYAVGPALDLNGVQALLMTSANGVRAFAGRNAERDLTVFAVGDATGRAAAEAGFSTVRSARGNVEDLAELVVDELAAGGGTLLHPAASDIAGDLAGRLGAAGYAYRREVLYETRPLERLSTGTCAAIRAGEVDGVLLYSPRTAKAFCSLVTAAEIDDAVTGMDLYALSSTVADAAGDLPWRAVKVAPEPNQQALLELLS